MSEKKAVGIARRLAELGRREDACRAYSLAIHQAKEQEKPAEELEGALYIFQNGGDYKIAYNSFLSLYRQGHFREDLLNIMTQAFYTPNQKLMQTRYEKNCRLLQKYPYLFRKDFPAFSQLSIRFFPFDNNGYIPFHVREERFGEYIDFNHQTITRNFFKDLENPILATDVYSMYELEYLNDNVRKSEYIGRENHIYLHYADWETFCSYLQVLNLRQLLEDKKIVFLIGDEVEQYPIDFKARFGIDYSQFPVRPLGIREVHRLIWHTQLSAHNGGDFFNEIFDNHPNLIAVTSLMMDNVEKTVTDLKDIVQAGGTLKGLKPGDGDHEKVDRLIEQLRRQKSITEKDAFVTLYLCLADLRQLDKASRIAPAIWFQPHFSNMIYGIRSNVKGTRAVLESRQYDTIMASRLFRHFKYIKTFTPVRRFTTSYGATVRFMYGMTLKARKAGDPRGMVSDVLIERVLNRSFMIDWQERLFKDCTMVRFEDGKLNPRATFTALAAFLDLPYTESMTYCSENGIRDPGQRGFMLETVYRTYEDYAGIPERYYLEYFMRDAYEYCGYDFQYYDGAPVDMKKVEELVDQMEVQDHYVKDSWMRALASEAPEGGTPVSEEDLTALQKRDLERHMQKIREKRLVAAEVLLKGLLFINENGQPLHMMPKLQLDPALLEHPLYH